jgi:hypothetical protein
MLEGRGEKCSALEIYQRCGTNSPMVILTGICLDSLGHHKEARECYQHASMLKGGDGDLMKPRFTYVSMPFVV